MRVGVVVLAAWVAAGQTPAPEGMKERGHLRNQRYCEVLLVKRQMLSAKASVYNTLGLNECPAEQWAALDAAAIRKEKGVTEAVLNGPRHFVMDRNALHPPATVKGYGSVERFGGLEMKLLATLEIKHPSKREPYTENAVDRETQYVYDAGKYVYELHAPDGRTYIMQSYSNEVDKGLNEEGLRRLGERLKLPKGWTYGARKVEKELVVRNAGSKAFVVQDELRNSYQRVE